MALPRSLVPGSTIHQTASCGGRVICTSTKLRGSVAIWWKYGVSCEAVWMFSCRKEGRTQCMRHRTQGAVGVGHDDAWEWRPRWYGVVVVMTIRRMMVMVIVVKTMLLLLLLPPMMMIMRRRRMMRMMMMLLLLLLMMRRRRMMMMLRMMQG